MLLEPAFQEPRSRLCQRAEVTAEVVPLLAQAVEQHRNVVGRGLFRLGKEAPEQLVGTAYTHIGVVWIVFPYPCRQYGVGVELK